MNQLNFISLCVFLLVITMYLKQFAETKSIWQALLNLVMAIAIGILYVLEG